MHLSLGILIGLAISFALWRSEIKNKNRENAAFDLYVDFLTVCNKGDEKEADKAWSRYLNYFIERGLNAAAFHPRFESRVAEARRIAKAVGEQRT